MCHLCIVCSPLYSPLVSVLALLVIERIRYLNQVKNITLFTQLLVSRLCLLTPAPPALIE